MEMWFSEFHTPDVKHSIRVNRQLYSKQSDYQRIDIFETPEFGRVLTLDGNVMLTERDEFIYDEMITHVPMSVHRSAKDILVIGAGDGGVVRELTRYDRVERIDLVEMDPQVIEACRAYLPGNACRMDDRRVHIYYENALKFIRKCEDEYDLIIVVVRILFRLYLRCLPQQTNSLIFVESFNRYRVVLWITCFCFPYWRQIKPYRRALPCKTSMVLMK